MANIAGQWTFKASGCVIVSTSNYICEEGNDKLVVIDIEDPCNVDDYDFTVHGTTRRDHCGCEWASSAEFDSYTTLTSQQTPIGQVQLNIYDLITEVPFKTCNDHAIDTILFELIEDNQGGSVATDANFSTDNVNSADIHLGSDAPASRYIAELLDQQSIKVSDQFETLITLDQSQIADIEGSWKFKVTGCVTDSSASLICD